MTGADTIRPPTFSLLVFGIKTYKQILSLGYHQESIGKLFWLDWNIS